MNNFHYRRVMTALLASAMLCSSLPSSAVMAADTADSAETAASQSTNSEISETVEEDAENLTVNGLDAVMGNLYLPEEGENGSSISWNSSNPEIITDEEDDGKAAGMVTRPDVDTDVTLTAIISDGYYSITKEFTAHVIAKSELADTTHYLFAHFTGEGYSNGEQIYFADSADGLNWDALNDGEPVIESELGERGVRDPFIIRTPDGDKFYLIATDLKIYGGNGWTAAQTAGSQSIMVWESTDLVNWSDQRMVKVAADNAGCTWAPEAVYNEETGNYMVFWASKTSDDNYSVQRIYYAETRDFYTFTEPELWIELHNTNGDDISVIDTSVIKVTEDDGSEVYYRISKDEASSSASVSSGDSSYGKFEILEKSDSLLGDWTRVYSYYLNNNRGVEGGTFFKFNDEDKWCLLLDNNGGVGYYPSITYDIGSGEFTKLDSDEYSFPSRMRHGTVIPITTEEYNNLEEKWGSDEEESTEDIDYDYSYSDSSLKNSVLMNLDFDDDENPLSADGVNVTAENGYSLVENELLSGNAIELSSSSKQWLDITKEDGNSLLSGLDEFAVNYWSKVTDSSTSNKGWTFYAAPDDSYMSWGTSGKTETYFGIIDALKNASISDKGLTVQRFNDSWSRPSSLNTTDVSSDWKMVTVTASTSGNTLYIDGVKAGRVESSIDLTDLFGTEEEGTLQIGKANWSTGEYFNGMIDNFTIYDRTISSKEVAAIYETKSYTGEISENPIDDELINDEDTDKEETVSNDNAKDKEETISDDSANDKKDTVSDDDQNKKNTDPSDPDNENNRETDSEKDAPLPKDRPVSDNNITNDEKAGDDISDNDISDDEKTVSDNTTVSKDDASQNDTSNTEENNTTVSTPSIPADHILFTGDQTNLLIAKNKYYIVPSFTVKKYQISNKKILSVNKKGLVKAKKSGSAIVTAIGNNGESETYNITVEKPKMSKLKVSAAGTYKISDMLSDVTYASFDAISSSNTSVAEVSESGTITVKTAGSTRITVIIDGRKYKAKLKAKF
ncbi:immunoglobulin-like domain-containing protein [Lachnospiraceae bacterium C1.1]|nr:hypothetical protein [Lachnospiraceae bacterium C1.1]